MYPEAFFKMHDVTDDLVKKRKESKTHFGDFVDKIIEVCKRDSKNDVKYGGKIYNDVVKMCRNKFWKINNNKIFTF